MLCMGYLTEKMPVSTVDYSLDGQCSSGTAGYSRAVTRNVELKMIVNGLAWVVEQYAFDREDDYFQVGSPANEVNDHENG